MATWKKVLVSGSSIDVFNISASGQLSIDGFPNVSASLASAVEGTATAGDGIFVNGNIVSVDSGSLAFDMAGTFLTASNGILNLSSSIGTLGTTEFTGSHTGSFTGNAANLIDLPATEADLVLDITANQSVGGVTSGTTINAGTSVESLLRQILITFIPSTVSNVLLRNNGGSVSTGVREVNSSITTDEFSISVTNNSPDGDPPINLSLTGSGATSGNFTNSYSAVSLSSGTNNVTISPDEVLNVSTIPSANSANITITARAQDPSDSSILTTARNYSYVYPFYYGADSTNLSATSGTGLETAGLTKLVQTKGNKSVTLQATSEFLYYAYPSRYGSLSSIRDGNNFDVTSNFTEFTVTIDGGNGWSAVSYYIYKSNTTTTITSQTYTFNF